jgi:hypothetical protein
VNFVRSGTPAHVLSVRTELDPILSVIAPLGLAAAAARPCLVIDLDHAGPPYPGRRSLADLVAEGPSRSELLPSLDPRHSTGVAVLRNGGVSSEEAEEMVQVLVRQWPAVVLRLSSIEKDSADRRRVVPVMPVFPGVLAPVGERAAVWQLLGVGQTVPGPGPVLPPISRSLITRLLSGRWEPRGRWVKGWRSVWDLPWP